MPNFFTNPELKMWHVGKEQSSFATQWHIFGCNGSVQFFQCLKNAHLLTLRKPDQIFSDEIFDGITPQTFHGSSNGNFIVLQAAANFLFGGISPNTLRIARVIDVCVRIVNGVVGIWALMHILWRCQVTEPVNPITFLKAVHRIAFLITAEPEARIGIHQNVLVVVREKCALGIVPTSATAPHKTPHPPPRKHLVHQQLQPRTVFVVDADQNHAVAGQQLTRQRQALVQKLQPLAVAVAVIGADKFIVVNPVFVAGVVGRVDVDDADFSGVRGAQQAQAVEVVALDDEVAVVLCPRWRVAGAGHQTRQHHVGIQGAVAGNGTRFPIQPHFLLGQLLHQQAAQLGGVEVLEAFQQAGRCRFSHVLPRSRSGWRPAWGLLHASGAHIRHGTRGLASSQPPCRRAWR